MRAAYAARVCLLGEVRQLLLDDRERRARHAVRVDEASVLAGVATAGAKPVVEVQAPDPRALLFPVVALTPIMRAQTPSQ